MTKVKIIINPGTLIAKINIPLCLILAYCFLISSTVLEMVHDCLKCFRNWYNYIALPLNENKEMT